MTIGASHEKLMPWISRAYERDMDMIEWLTVIAAGWGGAIMLVMVLLWSRH